MRQRVSRARRASATASFCEGAETSAPPANVTSAEIPKESFNAASLRKEIAIADQREMENAVRRGQLVESSEIAQEWSELCGGLKNAILAVPDRVAMRCEGEPARVIRELLMTELRNALHQFASALEESAA